MRPGQRRLAFSGSDDHTVRVWELQHGACLKVLLDHESNVHALGWHHYSCCLATGAEDGVINLWDVSTLEQTQRGGAGAADVLEELHPAQSLSIEHCEILCITPSADGIALFCGLEDGTIAVLGRPPDSLPAQQR